MNIQDQSFKITEIFEREIREICQPLFRQSDINYFHFCTFYDDGNAFTLVTNARWHDYFYKQDFQHHSQHFIEEGYCLTKARPSYAREVHDARNLFNIDNDPEEKHDLGDVDQPTFNKLFQRIEYYRTTQLMDPMKTASMSVKQKNHGRGIMETGDGTFALTTYDEADEFYNRK